MIDYSKNALASPVATQRCPTGAIVWLDETQGPVKGSKAKRIIRNEALPLASRRLRVANDISVMARTGPAGDRTQDERR